MTITIMQWVANNPQSMAVLAAGVDARLRWCALDGVSGDDVVMDVITRYHDAVLTGADDAHNLSIMRVYCYRRLVDVMRRDRLASYGVDDYAISDAIDATGRLGDILHALPKSHMQVLTMYYIEGWSLVEIAGRLGVSYASVRGLYARALVRAKKEACK